MNDNLCGGQFKEACCIDVMRIFDSCCSQDCLEDLNFVVDAADETIITNASYIKVKRISVSSVDFVIDPVPFNKGFYTVDLTYNFTAEIEVHTAGQTVPQIVYGTSNFSKRVILYGSDGSSTRFSSIEPAAEVVEPAVSGCACCSCDVCTLPVATVNLAPPVCLAASLGEVVAGQPRAINITIGIFAIIQLSRPVPLLVPCYEYCMPEKECSTNTDSPCELFDKMCFPASEFFPQALSSCDIRKSEQQISAISNQSTPATAAPDTSQQNSGGRTDSSR